MMSLALAVAVLAGCAAPAFNLPQKLGVPEKKYDDSQDGALAAGAPAHVEQMPSPPQSAAAAARPAGSQPAVADKSPVSVNFENIPLTTLIQVVFSDILGKTVSVDEKVLARRDLVTFRTPRKASAAEIESSMLLLLQSYGLSVVQAGGLTRIVPSGSQAGLLPEIRRGGALPEAPDMLRPVFQLVELQAVKTGEVVGWLRTLMQERVDVKEDPARNALLLGGTGKDVAAAIDAIRVLDQPVMAGRESLRISPQFWSANELAHQLTDILAAEGYAMPPPNYKAGSGGARYPLLILPLAYSNSLLVFALNKEILAHVQDWVKRLDQPNERASGKSFFTFTAKYTSAEQLAKTLGALFQQRGTSAPVGAGIPGSILSAPAAAPQQKPVSGDSPGGQALGTARGGSVVVDRATNTLIFQTDPDEYAQIAGLLRMLDKPAKAALIEVTVAELTLTDDQQLGIEWLLKEVRASGETILAGTLGGLSLGVGGLTIKGIAKGGDPRFMLNALASANRATILSSPRIMARNGETASIQVGQEVPVITSQQSTLSGTIPTGTGVLQTIQYRNTGVILNVTPIVHSGRKIDLKVEQEVSAAQPTVTGVNNSPTIATRKVQTTLTLDHGATVLLGGLISSDSSAGDSGIPGLKDIPLFGNFFGVESNKATRKELVVLITPYILENEEDTRQVTEAFQKMLPWLNGADADIPKRK